MTPFRQLEPDQIRRVVHGIGCVIASAAAGASQNLDLGGPGRTAILPFAYNRRSGAILGLAGDPFEGTLYQDPSNREQATWLLAQSEVLVSWDAPEVRHLLLEALPQVVKRAWVSVHTMIQWPEEGLRNPDFREVIEFLGMTWEPGISEEADSLLRLLGHFRPNRGEPFLLELLRRAGLAEA
jgi:hypothetical protein